MLSENKRLSLLIRKNYDRKKLDDYKSFFKGFNLKRLEYIDLEQSDEIREKIRSIFPPIELDSEMLETGSRNSKLIDRLSNTIVADDVSYVFTDDVEICGMFRASTTSILKNCLDIAFLAYDNTCFVTDSQFRFSVTINYNDIEDRDYPDKFEIQVKEDIE
jgi:hypothetical protein